MSSSPSFISSAIAITAPGSAAHAPAVGMAIMTPIALFNLHEGGHVEDDPVERAAVQQAALGVTLLERAALMAKDAVFVVRSRNALGNRTTQDADQFDRLPDHVASLGPPRAHS